MRTLLKHTIVLADGREVKRNIVFRNAKDVVGEITVNGRKFSVVLVKRGGRTVGVAR